jgi:hypothetical protein
MVWGNASTNLKPDLPPTTAWSASPIAGANTAEAVRTLYAVRMSSARNHDPRTFRETVSGTSLRTFETLHRTALGASRAQVEELPPTQQINVIALRLGSSRHGLGAGDLASIVLPLLDSSIYHDLGAPAHELRGVAVSGDTASAKVFTDGEDSLNRAFFGREKGL